MQLHRRTYIDLRSIWDARLASCKSSMRHCELSPNTSEGISLALFVTNFYRGPVVVGNLSPLKHVEACERWPWRITQCLEFHFQLGMPLFKSLAVTAQYPTSFARNVSVNHAREEVNHFGHF